MRCGCSVGLGFCGCGGLLDGGGCVVLWCLMFLFCLDRFNVVCY